MRGKNSSNFLGIAVGKGITYFFSRFNKNLQKPKNASLQFQIDSSFDGLNFELSKEKGEIRGAKSRREKVTNLSDFLVSSFNDSFLLTYVNNLFGKSYLELAFSDDLARWKKIGKIRNVSQPGKIASGYFFKEKPVLFWGGNNLHVGLLTGGDSDEKKDFLENKSFKAEELTEFKKLNDEEDKIKVANVELIDEGILVFYYSFHKRRLGNIDYLKLALFDKKNPTKLIWKPKKPIWEEKISIGKTRFSPIGVVRQDGRVISYWSNIWGRIYCQEHYLSLPFSKKLERPSIVPILEKHADNPLIEPILENVWESTAVFNPAAFYEDGEVHIIYRATGQDNVSVLGYAKSKDGRAISQRYKEPVYLPSQPFEGGCCDLVLKLKKKDAYSPYESGGGGWGGCEDPRITKIEDLLYLTYVAYDGYSPPRVALTSIKVDDFLKHNFNKWKTPVLISPPNVVDKNACILPEKVDGKYVIFHRVFPNILIDFVDTLEFNGKNWLKGKYKITPSKNGWDSRKLGIGPPPIKTKEGWLAIYQAVDDKEDNKYKMGAMLLDLNNPTRVLHRSQKPILEPSTAYENGGLKFGVVYPCGAVVIDGRLFVYYGGSDQVVCLATADLDEFVENLKYSGSANLETVNK